MFHVFSEYINGTFSSISLTFDISLKEYQYIIIKSLGGETECINQGMNISLIICTSTFK